MIRRVISCLLSVVASLSLNAKQHSKPNILFIFLDDLSCQGLGTYGNDVVKTPNIDLLSSEGVIFTNAYNMGGWNGAISIASRSQLLTGKYLWKAKAAADNKYVSDFSNNSLLPQVMHDAGYKTFMTGKWHVSSINPEQLFDTVVLPRSGGMPKDTPLLYNRPLDENDQRWLPWDTLQLGFWQGGKHWSEAQADVIIDYIQQSASTDQPHFMYCAFNAPHDPRQSPRHFVDKYPVESILLPENYLPEHPLNEQMGAGRSLRDEKLAPFPRTPFAVRKHMQEYYAIISHLDEQIGRILQALHTSGMDKNTLIVLAADNGLSVGQHGLIGKQSVYDHSMKVPLIFSGYGIANKGDSRSQLVYMQDLVPTIYEIAGINNSHHTDFRSLMNNLSAFSSKGRSYIYGAFIQQQRMIRDDRYKLFIIPDAKQVYLFDLNEDPLEMNNLYGKKKYNAIAERLFTEYLKEATLQEDPLKFKAKSLKEFLEENVILQD